MDESFEGLAERLAVCRRRGEETTAVVDLLVAMAAVLRSNEPQRILALGREACDLGKRLGYQRGVAYGLGYQGWAKFLLSEYEAAYALGKEALALFEALGDRSGQAMSLDVVASVEMSLGNFKQAIDHGILALQYHRETGNRVREAWTLHGFGTAFVDFAAYDQALEYYQDALAIFRAIGERVGEARALNGIGTVHQTTGDHRKALSYHLDSLMLSKETGNHMGEARALNDLGLVFHHLGNLDTALRYHRDSLRIREAVGNRQAQCTSLIHMGTLFLEQDNAEEALAVLQQALEIAESIKAKPRIYQAHLGLANVYEQRGDWEKALGHHRAYHQGREEVMGEEAQSKVNTVQVRFAVAQSEREAEYERQRNAELKQKNEQLAQLLHELKTTQAQLIQAEKMASLGQLTAGIAHEIKNPLNFVNNFSRLTIDLAEELVEVLAEHRDQQVDAVLSDVQDLLDDVTFNAAKIYEHGQRADSIVKSMLEHSRSGSGERRPVAINGLLDEYVNLAYHGMRASRPTFNVTIDCDYDEAVGEVDGIPQELGRVFINLLNNAFYAVHEQVEVGKEEDYAPTVTVSTRRVDEGIEIRVRDNGPGIPEDVLRKIFEPFYTTKPTGSGTGLGLSLSYDIITKGHGGHLAVESEEGAGATFIITLPARS